MKFHMRIFYSFLFSPVLLLLMASCKNESGKITTPTLKNSIRYATGLSIYKQPGYSIVKVKNPWPKATKDYTYILREANAVIPDSLKSFTTINVPIKTIIVTSTTHIPSLTMLSVEKSLVGFPKLDYISSTKVRKRIDAGEIKELGSNQSLNTEAVIDLSPSVIIGYGIDNNNQALDNLTKSGLKVLLNGDWNEQSSLGKAEWIKLFGALYGLEYMADAIFTAIETDYKNTLNLAKNVKSRPVVIAGAIFENTWYLPDGNSWGAQLITQAGGTYVFAESKGTGSLSLPFEKVLAEGSDATFWIGPGQFTSLSEMLSANPHY
ncbi:MAG: ABC transporter substrate-binding protein, partial [Proteobacteria bacterium]